MTKRIHQNEISRGQDYIQVLGSCSTEYCSHSVNSIAFASSVINFWKIDIYAAPDVNLSGNGDWSLDSITSSALSGEDDEGIHGPWRPKMVQSKRSSGGASNESDAAAAARGVVATRALPDPVTSDGACNHT